MTDFQLATLSIIAERDHKPISDLAFELQTSRAAVGRAATALSRLGFIYYERAMYPDAQGSWIYWITPEGKAYTEAHEPEQTP